MRLMYALALTSAVLLSCTAYASAQDQNQHNYGNNNDTTVNEIIEQLLVSRREGRNLDEQFNQVYADGNIDQALMQGNDMEARNLIRDKLCGLGLMSCDYEEKRPYYSTIYAQEMPPPPHNFRGGFNGPPRPMSGPIHGSRPPTPPGYGPPPRIGYDGPFKPDGRPSGPGSYNGPFLESPPSASGFPGHAGPTFDKPPPGAIIYGSKPPGPVFNGNGPVEQPPYPFESSAPVKKVHLSSSLNSAQSSFYAQQSSDSFAAPSNVIVGNKADAGLQQHVHHHYHHLEGAAAENAKVPTVGIPLGSSQVNTDFATLAQSSAAFNIQQGIDQSSSFTAGFNGASQGGLLSQSVGSNEFGLVQKPNEFGFGQKPNEFGFAQKPNGEFYKPAQSLNGLSGNSLVYQSGGSSGFGQTGFAPSSGSYHSQNPDYFKKELHNFGGSASSLNGISTGYAGAGYQGGYETARQQIIDCQCVPFNQCPAADRIGRKEDLILPIDPRNLHKDIEALSDAPATNSTETTESKTEAPKKEETTDKKRAKREAAVEDKQDEDVDIPVDAQGRAYYGNRPQPQTCRVNEVCCRRPLRPVQPQPQFGRCGVRNAAGITGRIKNPVYVDGDAEFGEYPWHVAILKKDPNESIYACGGTLIDAEHVITAAHCIKSQNGFDLRARLGEWDVNHDVEFFPYIERDVVSVHVHPEYYAGTLDNDLAILKLDHPVDFTKNPHISPACLPDKFSDWTGSRCWTTGWGKDAFGEHGKYQNILKEVDVPILSHHQCEMQLRQTRLGYGYKLNQGFICAGGEEGKDACKGDGGGPLVCERNGIWNAVGIVSWGIGCGQVNVPGVYVRVAHYLDWIHQITRFYQK